MALKSSLVVHRGVALMMCESSAILEETLLAVDTSELHVQRLSDRALAMPAHQIEIVRRALEGRGIYPKIVGADLALEIEELEDDGDLAVAGDEEST
ncbi:MAG: hypothetical protein H0U74_19335 [Bradymonadaceae bacterium]|nr:hypothetical protein [Lujinxingiaceae bacterium]